MCRTYEPNDDDDDAHTVKKNVRKKNKVVRIQDLSLSLSRSTLSILYNRLNTVKKNFVAQKLEEKKEEQTETLQIAN